MLYDDIRTVEEGLTLVINKLMNAEEKIDVVYAWTANVTDFDSISLLEEVPATETTLEEMVEKSFPASSVLENSFHEDDLKNEILDVDEVGDEGVFDFDNVDANKEVTDCSTALVAVVVEVAISNVENEWLGDDISKLEDDIGSDEVESEAEGSREMSILNVLVNDILRALDVADVIELAISNVADAWLGDAIAKLEDEAGSDEVESEAEGSRKVSFINDFIDDTSIALNVAAIIEVAISIVDD